MENYKMKNKGNTTVDVPKEFTKDVVDTIYRIEHCSNSHGVLFMKNNVSVMYTIPQAQEMILSNKLPTLTQAVSRAIFEITAAINSSNPMIDRIMDDESVEGVIMTNKEGAPVLTNVSVTHATLYGRALHKYGVMAMIYMKELDPFDDILVIRLHTKKKELILAPHREFHIIIVQHFRKAIKVTNVT